MGYGSRAVLSWTLLLATMTTVSAQQYAVIPLPTLGGNSSVASGISENGFIVGWAQLPSSARRAVIWDPSGAVLDLGLAGTDVVTEGIAVNSAGQVAGVAEGGDPQSYTSYIWSTGTWTPVGVLPGLTDTLVTDIDEAGRVVGRSLIVGPGAPDRAFIWDDGQFMELASLGYDARASAINESGQVAGTSSAQASPDYAPRAVRWDAQGIADLGVLPGEDYSQALGINARGDAVGSSWHVTSPQFFAAHQATLWRADGRIVDLGLTPSSPAGTCIDQFPFWTANIARAINSMGQVVGQAQCIASGGARAAFLWDPEDSTHYNLNDLIPAGSGLDLIVAHDINDAGQIVGTAVDDDGYLRAVLLEPIETCSSAANCDDGLYCNGAEICTDGVCQSGPDPCAGMDCDEDTAACIPASCDDDGTCGPGEDCTSCPGDCPGGGGGAPVCGDGICQPGSGENCQTCAVDCRGQQNGNPSNRYCCGLDVGCSDERCTAGDWACSTTPPAPYCCGDAVCDPAEDPCSCSLDCGTAPPIETVCNDDVDNDCDGLTDGADPECTCGMRGDDCLVDADCCSGVCKPNGTCR